MIGEYDFCASWCAKRGIRGRPGDRLPELLTQTTHDEINADPEAFERRVREFAYALAMAKHRFPADLDAGRKNGGGK